MWRPDVLLLGPAGAKCFLLLGAVKRLSQEPSFLSGVHTYAGVSAGAALSLLIILGYTIKEIEDISLDLNILDDIMNISLTQIKDNMGILRIASIEEKLKKCIVDKIGYIPTMKQLHILTGKKYVPVSVNIDRMEVEYLDANKYPDLPCSEATLMSMAVPILIQPRMYRGCVYVDGAIGAPYPVGHFDDGKSKILGIYVSSEDDPNSVENNPKLFLYKLIQAPMKILREKEIERSSQNVKHIGLKTLVKDTTGIMIDRKTRENMIGYGYTNADYFLKVTKEPEKYFYNREEEIPFS